MKIKKITICRIKTTLFILDNLIVLQFYTGNILSDYAELYFTWKTIRKWTRQINKVIPRRERRLFQPLSAPGPFCNVPGRHQTLNQCCFNVGTTLKQHWFNVSCVLGRQFLENHIATRALWIHHTRGSLPRQSTRWSFRSLVFTFLLIFVARRRNKNWYSSIDGLREYAHLRTQPFCSILLTRFRF